MRRRNPFALAAIAVVGVSFGVACGEGEAPQRAIKAVEKEAEVLEENVERSARVMKETYKVEREEGVGRVEAAGDAYEAVREIPLEKAAAEEEEKKKHSKDEKASE